LEATIEQLGADIHARAAEAEIHAQTLVERTTELEYAQQRVITLQNLFDAAVVRADEAESQVAALVEVENLLAFAQGEVEQLRGALGEMEALEFGARQERDQARSERDAARERMAVVEGELEAAEEAKK
jgi:chromosome segregation protein